MKNKNLRAERGQFERGTSGNPSGRPLGSRNQATLLAEQALKGKQPQLLDKLLELALKGNIRALLFCMERLVPASRERPVDLELKPAKDLAGIANNHSQILTAACEGRITPSEAQTIAGIQSAQVRLLEASELEPRIRHLEEFISEAKAERARQEQEMQRFSEVEETIERI